ncbi:hypothetical protein AB0J28_14685 [Streptosporangium canum]|uniref:hypothetical protein n=1 Tax=Streptosporangium canum TaxID=324952 RepID=UPI003416FB1F
MPPFKHLTIEEARTLNRNGLLPRIEAEQAYWPGRIERGLTQWDSADYLTFRRIKDVAADAAGIIADGPAQLRGLPGDEGYMTQPLGERGGL